MADTIQHTTSIVTAYLETHAVSDLPTLVRSVGRALASCGGAPTPIEAAKPPPPRPAPPPPDTLPPDTEDFVTCRECGEQFRSLTRHLNAAHGMNKLEYRVVHGAKAPIVSRNCARVMGPRRSATHTQAAKAARPDPATGDDYPDWIFQFLDSAKPAEETPQPGEAPAP